MLIRGSSSLKPKSCHILNSEDAAQRAALLVMRLKRDFIKRVFLENFDAAGRLLDGLLLSVHLLLRKFHAFWICTNWVLFEYKLVMSILVHFSTSITGINTRMVVARLLWCVVFIWDKQTLCYLFLFFRGPGVWELAKSVGKDGFREVIVRLIFLNLNFPLLWHFFVFRVRVILGAEGTSQGLTWRGFRGIWILR